jgi:hypothetical protein
MNRPLMLWILCVLPLICTVTEGNSIREQGLDQRPHRSQNAWLPEHEDKNPLSQTKILQPLQAHNLHIIHQNTNLTTNSLSNENDLLSQILKDSSKPHEETLVTNKEKVNVESNPTQKETTQLVQVINRHEPKNRVEQIESHDDDAAPDEEDHTATSTPTPSQKKTTTTPTPSPSVTPAVEPSTSTNSTQETTTQSIKSWLGWDEYLTLSYLAVTVISLGGCLLGCLLGCLCLRSGMGGPGKVEETSRVFDSDDEDE